MDRENYEKELNFKQGMLDSKEMMNSLISKELSNFRTAYDEVSKTCTKLQEDLQNKNQEVMNIYASEEYQKGIQAIKKEKSLYPVKKTVRGIKHAVGLVFRPVKIGAAKIAITCGKIAYNVYPVKEHKRKLKNKILFSEKLARMCRVKTYREYCEGSNVDKILLENGQELNEVKFQIGLNKTIGIHLHLYYTDLLDEFYNYFSNIPYVFDLYVSVMKGADVNKITKKFNKILNLNKVKVVETPNSGRDFGAMFVEFNNDLKKYDYIMHVHTKKSLRLGSEQTEWRHFMLDHLLGSTDRVMKCFYLMEQMNMGMVYVDSFPGGSCPYWINTWLDEAPKAKNILNRMGMKFKDEILQFPAGSMFWAKTDALRQLFDLNLTWEEFGIEEGKNEGTLAYVFERITGTVARNNGYKLAIYNVPEGRYRENKGEQLLGEYFTYNKDNVFENLKNYDIISFDIFDTLITRNVITPSDSFKLIADKISRNSIKLDDYVQLRGQAEFNVRKNKNFTGDCNINEIYDELQKITNLSTEDIKFIKETEIDTELLLAIPRKDMLELYNRLLQVDKKIVLVSDMYLTKDIVEKLLNKCGYHNYFEIMISSELGKRKDNGTMWEYFFEKYKDCNTIHVGDNEESDIHQVIQRYRPAFHIMNGSKLMSMMRRQYVLDDEELNLAESVAMGAIINRSIVNSPFIMNTINSHAMINSYYDFGFSVLGPVIYKYMKWIVKMAKESKGKEVLLFSAREGYYLQKLYNIFKEKLNILDNIEDHYLYISRRAITVMQIETLDDVREILKPLYFGTLRELLYYRLNYKEDNFKDEIISLPRDTEKVMKVVENNFDIILENAKKERENYLKYIESLKIDFDNKEVSMLDLGYSGTAQYYFSKLLNKKISGKYFVVKSDLKPVKLGCKVYSCFNKNIYNKAIDKNILRENSLLLEALLTSPDGQFTYMDIEDGKFIPQFLHEPNKKEHMENLDQVYEGVKEFTEMMLDTFGDEIFEYDIDNKYIYRCYENCIKELDKFTEKMQTLFFTEDYYCSNAVLNTMDILKSFKIEWNYE